MATKKKVVKVEEVTTKTFYRVESYQGAWALVEIVVDSNGKVVSSKQHNEDVLPNTMHVLQRMIKDEYGI